MKTDKSGNMRKILALLLAAAMLLTVSAAAFADEAKIDYTTGTPWLCSFLETNITPDTPKPDLADDFFLACNLEALQELEIPDGYNRYGTQEAVAVQTIEDVKNLFTSGDEAESHDAQLALNLYSLYMDWDSRNALGVAPLKELTDAVEAIDSLDTLTHYLSELPPEDQIFGLYVCFHEQDLDDASSYILEIDPAGLMMDDAAEYRELTALGKAKKDEYSALASKILIKLGYSEEEAAEKIENCLAFETELASAMLTVADRRKPDYISRINNHYTREELAEAQGNVPLIATFEKSKGYPEADHYLLTEPDWLARLNSLYTEEHLTGIKDYLIVNGIIVSADSLDRECYGWFNDCNNAIRGSIGDLPIEIIFSQRVADILAWPVARLYCEKYLDQGDKERISALIDEIISEYHGIINEADFLSDATKAAAIEKLEAIDKRVLWPDDWSKYGCEGLEIPSAADGGSLWEAKKEIVRYNSKKNVEEYSGPFDAEKWTYIPSEFNCGYDPGNNSILILGAFAQGDMYHSEMSDEELFSRLGIVIGHEISHAFDSTGAQFDKNGNLKQWWADEDWAAFEQRVDKLVEYYDKIHPWEGQDYLAAMKSGEACADMGGLKCMLRLAAKREGFDYDRFFRSFAHLWMSKGTLNTVYAYINDEHPLPYLRVNCIVQQYDEFLDFYGIKEGDGMYLAPEDRVNIW